MPFHEDSPQKSEPHPQARLHLMMMMLTYRFNYHQFFHLPIDSTGMIFNFDERGIAANSQSARSTATARR